MHLGWSGPQQKTDGEVRSERLAATIGASFARFQFAADRPGKPVICVSLHRADATDSVLERLTSFSELEGLEVMDYISGIGGREDWRVTDAGAANLRKLKRLHRLFLPSMKITDAGLAVLADMPQLQELAIGNPSGYVIPGKQKVLPSEEIRVADITDAGLEQLARLPRLHSLTLFGTRVTNDGLKLLPQFKELRHLTIYLIDGGLTERGFVNLAKLHALQSLTIIDFVPSSSNSMTAGLAELTTLRALEALSITSLRVHDYSLESIGRLARLKNLSLSHGIATMPVTDAGLEHLQGLSDLLSLRLGILSISDKGLNYMSRLSKLENIDVSSLTSTTISDSGLQQLSRLSHLMAIKLPLGGGVTSKGLEQLRKSLPDLTILDPSP